MSRAPLRAIKTAAWSDVPPGEVIRDKAIGRRAPDEDDPMDLNAPLGRTPPPPLPRRARRVAWVACGLVAAGALATAGTYLVTADLHGGEPYAVASIPPQAPKPARPPAPVVPLDPVPTGSIMPQVTSSPQPTQAPPAVQIGQQSGPLIIDVAKALADRGRQVATIVPSSPAVFEPPQSARTQVPRVAIFVGGMGLSSATTRIATALMPSAVAFAFLPYGDSVAAAVAAAKARGHEILLQMPMQNAGASTPGPHALRPGEPAAEVSADAAWLMGRIVGYDGVTNLLGAPVTADRPVMGALLKAVAARGLFYLDDGTSKRSLGQGLALEQGLPASRADVVLDATADPAVVHANLEALVAIAKRKGTAIGMASGLPDHLAAIAAFAAALRGRGVKLVPVKAIVSGDATVAVAR